MYPFQLETKTFIIIVTTIYCTCSEKKMVMFCKGNFINLMHGSFLKKKRKLTESFVSCRIDNVWNF